MKKHSNLAPHRYNAKARPILGKSMNQKSYNSRGQKKIVGCVKHPTLLITPIASTPRRHTPGDKNQLEAILTTNTSRRMVLSRKLRGWTNKRSPITIVRLSNNIRESANCQGINFFELTTSHLRKYPEIL